MITSQKIKNNNWDLLTQQIEYAINKSPYYKRLFKYKNVDFSSFKYENFLKIPLTQKKDLAQYNDDFIAVEKHEIIEYVTTSGTLGNPVTFALNEEDLQRLALNEQKSFNLTGVTKNDIVQLTTTLDKRFIAGLAYFLGLRKIGAGLIRVGAGAPALQWDSIQRFKPTYLVAVPSFLVKLVLYAQENQIDFKNSSIKGVICIGEALRDENHELNSLGKKINSLWDVELFSTYASTEMCTAFTECPQHQGLHIPEDLIYTEILNEEGKEVEIGEVGELVVTTLGVKTMPLLRYATGDLVKKLGKTCSCKQATPLISSVLGRKQQLIKYKGTSVYPQQIINVLATLENLPDYQIQVALNEMETDELTVIIPLEVSESLEQSIKEILKGTLRVTPLIKRLALTELKSRIFPEGSRKPVRFLDVRRD